MRSLLRVRSLELSSPIRVTKKMGLLEGFDVRPRRRSVALPWVAPQGVIRWHR